ncbi:PQQ-dependent sugar dehydrogenase, partial [Pseudomonadota bacterium]
MKWRLALFGLTWFASLQALPAHADGVSARLTLPPGFSISLYAQVPGARSLVVVEELGVVFVSSRGDAVYAVPLDRGAPSEVLSGLKVPNGIAWKDGYLYVAEQHRLVRFAAPSLDALANARAEVLYDRLPDSRHHGWRYIAFGPDGGLYMGIGAPCNVCTPKGLEGTVTRFDSGAWDQPRVVAWGVRNTVGMDTHPKTAVLHFTDNGADMMGDDSPPDELNALDMLDTLDTQAPQSQHFGYPWFGGGTDRTSDFANSTPPPSNPPVIAFQAHVAALGIDFYSGAQFPAEYVNDAFVAQHGSWNRSTRVGYQVVRVKFDRAGRAIGYEPFITGW